MSSLDDIGRDPLIAAITTFLAGHDPSTLESIRTSLGREIDQAGPAALAGLGKRLASAEAEWHYYPRDPLARRIHAVLAEHLLTSDSRVSGLEHLARVANSPVVIVANHLSYADANLLEILLQRAGAEALANRLTVLAGPKVYSSVKRRFSSLCFGTIRTSQSSSVSSEDAVMDARAVARAARRVIEVAHQRLSLGEALLLFAEGTRSRSNGMRQLLPAASRYLQVPGTWMLPIGVTGTEALFPIGAETIHAVTVTACVGQPVPADWLRTPCAGNRRVIMDVVGLAIADLLPPKYRGFYGGPPSELIDERRLSRSLFSTRV